MVFKLSGNRNLVYFVCLFGNYNLEYFEAKYFNALSFVLLFQDSFEFFVIQYKIYDFLNIGETYRWHNEKYNSEFVNFFICCEHI